MNPILFGIDNVLTSPPAWLRTARIGVLVNQASLTAGYQYTHEALFKIYGSQIKAIFSPQHGLWGEQQANMIETPHSFSNEFQVPIHSLYSEQRDPTPEMLQGIDCLVIDLQDVGTRVYTFIWTILKCMQACAKLGIRVLILDRPNPIGRASEGPCLTPGYESFVGLWSIPMRHGLTYGELATLLVKEMKIDVALDVIPLQHNPFSLPFGGRHWVGPSPNVPTLSSVLAYAGQVLLEGTNLSEGRGTTIPFEFVGAPYVKASLLLQKLASYTLPGVVFVSSRVIPTFDKWQNQSCEGIRFIITDAEAFLPYKTSVAIIAAIAELWPQDFKFLPPPYEYETIKMPIDILSGNKTLRESIESGPPLSDDQIVCLSETEASWIDRMETIKMY